MKKEKKAQTQPFIKESGIPEQKAEESTPILEQLYYGDIKPGILKSTPAYQKAVERMKKPEDEILRQLGKEHEALFTEYLEKGQQDLLDIASIESFTQGYRLGARLMLAALLEDALPFPVNIV